MATIQIRGLVKQFGPVTAVNGLSFDVTPGTVTGFLGPNGAGKTTTLRILLGLVSADAGTATIDGLSYRELPEPLHQAGPCSRRLASTRAGPPARSCGSRRWPRTPTRPGSRTSST